MGPGRASVLVLGLDRAAGSCGAPRSGLASGSRRARPAAMCLTFWIQILVQVISTLADAFARAGLSRDLALPFDHHRVE